MTQILVVDDEEVIRSLLVSFLTLTGYEAVAAQSGATALALATRLSPQAIFLDVSMPGMDGIETLQRLRELVPQATIIMMSGSADQATTTRALALGAREFVQKPFDLQHVERVILPKSCCHA